MSLTLSIIVTTYNRPDYLERVLAGYLGQSVFPDELLVADDGSGRETAERVERFRRVAPFPVSHVWQEDLGFRAAGIRNEAVKASTGDYIVFSDGDCIPHVRFVEDHVRLACAGWFVQGKRMLLGRGASPRIVPSGALRPAALWLKGELSGFHHLLRIPGLAIEQKSLRGIKTCNFGVFRKDLLAVNGFDEDFVGWGREDAEFAARLLASGVKRKDPPFSALVYHLWHEENSRERLAENDRLLQSSAASGKTMCRNGIRKVSPVGPGVEGGRAADRKLRQK
ncbi:MAG: glycosyltransferase family 2 protein [Desulfobacteraceae bacterium]|nr:glycosyltransferase family 2 protein [Desulfobacteraceae bacterium]